MEEIKKLVDVLNNSKLSITMQENSLVVETKNKKGEVEAKHTIKLRPTNIDGVEEWKYVARKSNRV